MEFLQAAVRGNHVFKFGKSSGFFEQELFLGEVFLEVVIAEFLVDFEIVGEAFAGFLEALPHARVLALLDVAHCIELVLKLAVAGECAVYVVGVLCERENLFDDGVLALKVSGLDCSLL